MIGLGSGWCVQHLRGRFYYPPKPRQFADLGGVSCGFLRLVDGF